MFDNIQSILNSAYHSFKSEQTLDFTHNLDQQLEETQTVNRLSSVVTHQKEEYFTAT